MLNAGMDDINLAPQQKTTMILVERSKVHPSSYKTHSYSLPPSFFPSPPPRPLFPFPFSPIPPVNFPSLSHPKGPFVVPLQRALGSHDRTWAARKAASSLLVRIPRPIIVQKGAWRVERDREGSNSPVADGDLLFPSCQYESRLRARCMLLVRARIADPCAVCVP
jgi:hypothetical protein